MRNIYAIVCLVGLLTCMGWCLYLHMHLPKIAYVRSAVLLDKYAGMIAARNNYRQKMEHWQSELDTLSQQFKVELTTYQQQSALLNSQTQQMKQKTLTEKQAQLEQLQYNYQQKAKQEEEQLLQGTLNQINSYVEQYAKEEGYTVVLGTTQSGNLLYAQQAVDITDQVLAKLNASYK